VIIAEPSRNADICFHPPATEVLSQGIPRVPPTAAIVKPCNFESFRFVEIPHADLAGPDVPELMHYGPVGHHEGVDGRIWKQKRVGVSLSLCMSRTITLVATSAGVFIYHVLL
jgi:hypothetical protein